jgi:large subunit ribosomal protein L19
MQYLTYQDQKFGVGDTVTLHQEIAEGNKKRVQAFEGIIIAVKGRQAGKSITLRKISSGNVAVEKIFPINLPSIKKIVLKRQGKVRRAKLYFLRQKVGRSATRIKEKSVAPKKSTPAQT